MLPQETRISSPGLEFTRFWAKLTKSDIPGEPHHPLRIYNYYCVHLKMAPQPALVLDISEYWEQKLAAVSCYRSQFIQGRPVTQGRPEDSPTFLQRLHDEAAWWGSTIGTRYGEPFACREPIGLRNFGELI